MTSLGSAIWHKCDRHDDLCSIIPENFRPVSDQVRYRGVKLNNIRWKPNTMPYTYQYQHELWIMNMKRAPWWLRLQLQVDTTHLLTRSLERVRELRALERGGHILPPAISALRNARNTKLGGKAHIRTLNLVTLGQHPQGQMTSSMQNFRTFWSNVQCFALAGLAPKLKQIASICKKGKMRNE